MTDQPQMIDLLFEFTPVPGAEAYEVAWGWAFADERRIFEIPDENKSYLTITAVEGMAPQMRVSVPFGAEILFDVCTVRDGSRGLGRHYHFTANGLPSPQPPAQVWIRSATGHQEASDE